MNIPANLLEVLHDRAAQLGDRPALWSKRDGVFLPTSWRDYGRRVRHLALGLIDLGVQPGDKVGILAYNREEWVIAELAAMAAGAIPVGLFLGSSPDQLHEQLEHAEVRLLVVENEAGLKAVQALRSRLPRLEWLVVIDPPAVTSPGASAPPGALLYQELVARGAREGDSAYYDRVNALDPEGLALLVYTSGTTGEPRGVMLSHRNLAFSAVRLLEGSALIEPSEVIFSYQPLAHIAEQLCGLMVPLVGGLQVAFCTTPDRPWDELNEVRPTVFFGVPRVWEKLQLRADQAMASLPPRQARMIPWARRIALQRVVRQLQHERVPVMLEASYRLARELVLDPIKARLGFGRCHLFGTSAAPIRKELLEYFASLDIVIRESYGLSEACGPVSLNTDEFTRLGSGGRPLLGIELRIGHDGEVQVRGPSLCQGYYKEAQATREMFESGWLRTGDLGELDPEGFLNITGRRKEIIVTSGGKKTAPAPIESLLRGLGPIGHALVVGDNRAHLVALLPLDKDQVPAFARKHGFPDDPRRLAGDPVFLEHLDQRISEDVNPKLSRFEAVRRFAVLPADFSVEGGELTPTLKVRRKVVEEKYASVIEGLYS
jgi:long-chain acyl-CoA synthetase